MTTSSTRVRAGALITAVLGSILLVPAGAGASGAPRWAKGVGGAGNDLAHGIAVAPDGSAVIAGRFTGKASFGGDELTSAGRSDLFVAAYDAAGAHLWSIRGGGKGIDGAQHVDTLSGGDVLIAGSFTDKASIGGIDLVGVGREMFVARLAGATGEAMWAIARGGNKADHATTLAVDASDDVIVTGYFSDVADFGGGEFTSAGSRDIFVAKFDGENGRHMWSVGVGGPRAEDGTSVAIGPNGEAYVAGRFGGTMTVGEQVLHAAGSGDGLVMKLAGATGVHLWAVPLGASGSTTARKVAVDAAGDVYATGFYAGTTAFGAPTPSRGSRDIFLTKLAGPTGAVVWATTAGGKGSDTAYAIAVDVAGDVVLAGSATGPAGFGGGPIEGIGRADAFLASYDGATGGHVWSTLAGGKGYDRIDALGLDGDANPVVAGWIAGKATLGETKLEGAGRKDAFIGSFAGDAVAPASTISTAANAVLINVPSVQTTLVTGTATDDRIGVAKVVVTFSVPVAGVVLGTVEATLQCTDERRSCTWSAAPPPNPGPMQVSSIATDRANNTEDPGPTPVIFINV